MVWRRRRAPAKAAAPKPTETHVQVSILELFDYEFDAFAIHIPNGFWGAGNGAVEWAKMLRLGAKVGAPDLLVLWAPGKLMFMEVKRPGGKPRKGQAEMHVLLRAMGFYVCVVDNLDDARWHLKAAGVPTKGSRLPSGAYFRHVVGAVAHEATTTPVNQTTPGAPPEPDGSGQD